MTARPGWLDEPEHNEPVVLGQAVAEWADGQPRPEAQDSEAGQ